MDRMLRIAGIIAFCVAAGAVSPNYVQAQDEQVITASPKGLIGLGILGAELGLVIPAAAGLDDTWAMITFPLVGAVGGALIGHFALDEGGHTDISVAMLVTSLVLVIPTVVLTLTLTAYDPDDDIEELEDLPEGEEGRVSDPPADVEVEPVAAARDRVLAGGGLFHIAQSGLTLGMPNFAIAPMFSNAELAQYGGEQATEFNVSLFSGAF